MHSMTFRPAVELLDARLAPAVLFVDDDGRHLGQDVPTSIQAAVDAASPGDTVRVLPGTYPEQVRIETDDLTLEATSRGRAVITPPAGGVTGNNILVAVAADTDGVVVDGFTLFGASDPNLFAAIGADVGSAVVVRNNTVTALAAQPLTGDQDGLGIVLNGADATVANNSVSLYQKAGIVAFGPGTVTITGNTVAGAGATGAVAQIGIQASDGVTATVRNNLVSGNLFTGTGGEAAGIVLQAAGAATVSNNKLADNQIGVAAQGQTAGLTVSTNQVAGSRLYGISLTDSTGVVRGNSVTQTGDRPLSGSQTGLGILLDGSTATVADNTVREYQKAGIVAFGPGSVAVTGNTVVGGGPTDVLAQNGIQVSDGVNAVVSGNAVRGNVFTPAGTEATGIVVFQAGVVAVTGNTLTGNEIGVALEGQTAGALVANNRVADSTLHGVSLSESAGAAVLGNRVTGSGQDGVRLNNTRDSVVLNNQVTGSGRYGISLLGASTGNTVAFNRVRASGTQGVFVGPDAVGNLVFGNG